MYNTCRFRRAEMLVGVPHKTLEASGHGTQRLPLTAVRSSAATTPGSYALTAPQPPKVAPAVRRATPINSHSLLQRLNFIGVNFAMGVVLRRQNLQTSRAVLNLFYQCRSAYLQFLIIASDE